LGVHAATGSPIAKEALDRIGDLYKVEKTIAGLPPDVRRRERQQRSKPIAEALAAWAETTLRRLSRKSELAKAFRLPSRAHVAKGFGGRCAASPSAARITCSPAVTKYYT
jgi:hypothetical protein